jgi:hypothetical protein
MLKRIVIVALVAAAGYFYWYKHDAPPFDPLNLDPVTATAAAEHAFRDHRSGLMVTAEGVVDRILSDDTQGSHHQRFILRLASGQTLLVTHNVDLAPRVPGLVVGSPVTLHGQYEWNDKGGLVHWTHKDPKGTHEPGWIEFAGKRYD